jgi:hypothetical protein
MGRSYGARTLDLAPGSPSVKRAYLDRSMAGDLAPPRQSSPRSAASSTQKPPMCSLVSMYGPSVTTTLPAGARSDLALLAGGGHQRKS